MKICVCWIEYGGARPLICLCSGAHSSHLPFFLQLLSHPVLFSSSGFYGANLSVSLPSSIQYGPLCGWPGTSSSSASTWT